MARARMAFAALVLLVLSCGSAAPAHAMPRQSARMIAEINEFRSDNGLAPLRGSNDLVRSSRRYARWMLAHDYFGHQPSIQADGSFRALGETIAYHSGWAPAIRLTLTQWRNSPGHRAVLLSRSFRAVGAGAVKGRFGDGRATAWVVQVGR